MQTDVRFGLVVATGVVLACGSKRLTFTIPETSAATAIVAPDSTLAVQPKELAAALDSPNPSKDSTKNALADLFPADLREPTKDEKPVGPSSPREEPESRPKKGPSQKPSEPSIQVTGEKSDDLVLPGMDWLDDKRDEKNGERPKRLPEGSTTERGKGPAHAYFQRYLDEGVYFVREGETLDEIAHNLFQDTDKARSILESNSDLLKSAEDIRPGMRLKLPKL